MTTMNASSSSHNSNNSSSNNNNNNNNNTTDRIADYFCILGTGDQFKIKSNTSPTTTTTNNNDNDNLTLQENNEQAAALVERFYREIVHVQILCLEEDTHNNNHTNDWMIQRYNEDGYVVLEHTIVPLDISQNHKKQIHLPHNHTSTTTYNKNTTTDGLHNEFNEYEYYYSANLNPLRDIAEEREQFISDQLRQKAIKNIPSSQGMVANDNYAKVKSTSFRAGVAGHKVHSLIRESQSKIMSIRNNTDVNSLAANKRVKFVLAYRRRGPEDVDMAGVADMDIFYACVPRTTGGDTSLTKANGGAVSFGKSRQQINAVMKRTWNKATTSINGFRINTIDQSQHSSFHDRKKDISDSDDNNSDDNDDSSTSSLGLQSYDNHMPLHHSYKQPQEHWALTDIISIPTGYDELIIPEGFQTYAVPMNSNGVHQSPSPNKAKSPNHKNHVKWHSYDANVMSPDNYQTKARIFPQNEEIETSYLSPMSAASMGKSTSIISAQSSQLSPRKDRGVSIKLYSQPPSEYLQNHEMLILPVLAIRRQKISDNERFNEDSAICDLSLTFRYSDVGISYMEKKDLRPIIPGYSDDDEEENDDKLSFLKKTEWQTIGKIRNRMNVPILIVRKNDPVGFADIPFEASVQDRFPSCDYKGLPMPVEELPLFCYPQGCRLLRTRLSDIPLPSSYGFVLKNIERGDSIYVSCVSFYEPITKEKIEQLNAFSRIWRRTSLAHAKFCQNEEMNNHIQANSDADIDDHNLLFTQLHIHDTNDDILMGFDETVTLENKVICIISRYPYWRVFRRFLGNLHSHSISGSSDLPLERIISHFLLTVPLPIPGGPIIQVPISSSITKLSFSMPNSKDLPLLDLSFTPLFACMDIPTIVVVVIGFLALERKIIVISTHSHLLINVCELFRSLLFPFELCAPYVPRLTETFISTLEFPGATFVGIHDDGCAFAKGVRQNIPEEAILLDLDTCEIHSNGDRFEVVRQCWNIIPSNPRSALVNELEILCQDAGIVPGQEPLESQIDLAFDSGIDASVAPNSDDYSSRNTHHLDDRAIRDAFLRFFCSVLGGYERYLVVPDADFMISGNEWFDSQGFVGMTQSDFAPYLGFLVSTQLFQSFVQKRTESSDMHCLLFDECLAEYHSVQNRPYGRLGSDCVISDEVGETVYSLLIDQCSSEPIQTKSLETTNVKKGISSQDNDSFPHENSSIDKTLSFAESSISATFSATRHNKVVAESEDKVGLSEQYTNSSWTNNHSSHTHILMSPDKRDLPSVRFSYFVDGQPCFPHKFNSSLFYPSEPKNVLSEIKPDNLSYVIRSGNEISESDRRRNAASTRRGLHSKRRCLWQLPKIMASHVLGAWLMCIPSQVSQNDIASDQRERYLLRALGAMRLLRNRHRVIPDEASYRALMVACGRVDSDRRLEIVKLFGMLRSDDIFPSAVTLGQYTKAVAEGFSKRSTAHEASIVENEDQLNIADQLLFGNVSALDTNLSILEQAGSGWRKRSRKRHSTPSSLQSFPWNPILCSSSFIEKSDPETKPYREENFRFVALWSKSSFCEQCEYEPLDEEVQACWDSNNESNEFTATMTCPRCNNSITPLIGYRILTVAEALKLNFNEDTGSPDKHRMQNYQEDEKVRQFVSAPSQSPPNIDITSSKWSSSSVASFENTYDISPTPPSMSVTERYKTLSNNEQVSYHASSDNNLPSQLRHFKLDQAFDFDEVSNENNHGYIPYIDPSKMRTQLEEYVSEYGDKSLARDSLLQHNPALLFSLWWYSARFSLPLPLPIVMDKTSNIEVEPKQYCAFASFDQQVALKGCQSAALSLRELNGTNASQHPNWLEKFEQGSPTLGDIPLLANFNLQTFCQSDWENPLLSGALVALVEACDKLDFKPVVDSIQQYAWTLLKETGNEKRTCDQSIHESSIGSPSDLTSSKYDVQGNGNIIDYSKLLDCYRVMMYLARYQCTSAFHRFFPTSNAKPCKGYHFWCASGSCPHTSFDSLFEKALSGKANTPAKGFDQDGVRYNGVSDIAIGFRCVFGHII